MIHIDIWLTDETDEDMRREYEYIIKGILNYEKKGFKVSPRPVPGEIQDIKATYWIRKPEGG